MTHNLLDINPIWHPNLLELRNKEWKRHVSAPAPPLLQHSNARMSPFYPQQFSTHNLLNKTSYLTHNLLNKTSYLTHNLLNKTSYLTHNLLNKTSYLTHKLLNKTFYLTQVTTSVSKHDKYSILQTTSLIQTTSLTNPICTPISSLHHNQNLYFLVHLVYSIIVNNSCYLINNQWMNNN